MAKKRGTATSGTGRKRPAARRRRTARRPAQGSPGRRGAREAQRQEAARWIGPPSQGVPLGEAANEPTVSAAEVPPIGGASVPGYARLVDTPTSLAAEARRYEEARRREAETELGGRREQAEASAQPVADGILPSASTIGLELLIGALRLARTIATAPIRIGLAFLRPREE